MQLRFAQYLLPCGVSYSFYIVPYKYVPFRILDPLSVPYFRPQFRSVK